MGATTIVCVPGTRSAGTLVVIIEGLLRGAVHAKYTAALQDSESDASGDGENSDKFITDNIAFSS